MLDLGSVLSEAWELYRRFFLRFVGIAVAVFLVISLVQALASAAARDNVLAAVIWGIVGLVVSVVGFVWLQGALVAAVDDVRDGRADEPVAALFRRVRPRLPALLVGGVLAGLGVAVGLLLLIVPGLYLLTRWILLAPVIVLEGRRAGEAFSRSSELVRGHGWKVVALILLTLVISIVASSLVGIVLAPLPEFLDAWLGGLISNSLTAPFFALAWTLTYYRLARPEPAAVAA